MYGTGGARSSANDLASYGVGREGVFCNCRCQCKLLRIQISESTMTALGLKQEKKIFGRLRFTPEFKHW